MTSRVALVTGGTGGIGTAICQRLADQGHRRALAEDPHLKKGLNVARGKITYKAVADAHGQPYTAPEEALGL